MTDLRNILDSVQETGRRQAVKAACLECRTKKHKCDGKRPCNRCKARDLECVFDTGINETPRQAGKRKFSEIETALQKTNAVLQQLITGNEPDAWAALHRLRSGDSVAAVAARLEAGTVRDSVALRYEQLLQQHAVISLCQSTAKVEDVVSLASVVLSQTTRMNLVGQASRALKDRIISLEVLTGTVSGTIEDVRRPEERKASPHVHNFYVPAHPWTEVTSNDDAVSHLISIFLRFANGYWCFLEEDLFLPVMRSRKQKGQYCSSLLVNAICAWASTYSEIDEAFEVPGQYITRGNHFFDEARRLWHLESGQPSIATVSALMIMAVDAAMRGKDAFAPEFCKAAVDVLKCLPPYDPGPVRDNSAVDYARARRNLAASVVWEELSNCAGLMRPLHSIAITTAELPAFDAPADTFTYWTGYPFTTRPSKFRGELLMYERRALTCFMEELLHIVAPGHKHSFDRMLSLAASLGDRMKAWHDGLHPDLRCTPDMPTPLFEFHVQFYGLMIRLYNRAWIIAFGGPESATVERVEAERNSDDGQDEAEDVRQTAKEEFPSIALQYAYKGATLLRDFRVCYGMKICVPYILQHAAENIFVLLLNLPSSEDSPSPAPPGQTPPNAPISSTRDAFGECFRTLLGAGSQIVLPRAITRMVLHTAVKLKMRLPDSVQRVLKLVASTNWAISDLDLIDSIWPNLALKDELYVNGDARRETEMGKLLRKWEKMGIQDQNLIGSEDRGEGSV